MKNAATKRLVLLLGFVVGFLPVRVAAQEFTGNIVGVVSDSTGGVMPGVNVVVSGETIQGTRTMVTESNGSYRVTLLPPGTYKVVYQLDGFATLTREGVLVGVGRTSTINVTLQVATLSDAVTVSGETPVVDLQSVTRGTNYDDRLLTSLPTGSRNFGGIMTTTPGIQVTAYDVGGSNMGTNTGFRTYGLSGQWNVRVDGVTTQDTASNLNLYFDYGAISEMQVSAAMNSAESNVPGAAVNMTVKSGGNQLHGMFLMDFQGKTLQSDNLTPELTENGIGVTDEFDRYHDLNMNAGGPIKEDKLWWFYSFRDQGLGLEDANARRERSTGGDLPDESSESHHQGQLPARPEQLPRILRHDEPQKIRSRRARTERLSLHLRLDWRAVDADLRAEGAIQPDDWQSRDVPSRRRR